MDFYTNVIQRGNSLLVRGVDKGKRISQKVNYRPTLYGRVPEYTGYKTLDGINVLPKVYDSIKEAKEHLQRSPNQKIVFGNNQYSYCYIGDEYPGDVSWNKDQILIVTIDIEVECENGFPNPKDAVEPILSITMKNHQNKKIYNLHDAQMMKSKLLNVKYVSPNTQYQDEKYLNFQSIPLQPYNSLLHHYQLPWIFDFPIHLKYTQHLVYLRMGKILRSTHIVFFLFFLAFSEIHTFSKS